MKRFELGMLVKYNAYPLISHLDIFEDLSIYILLLGDYSREYKMVFFNCFDAELSIKWDRYNMFSSTILPIIRHLSSYC